MVLLTYLFQCEDIDCSGVTFGFQVQTCVLFNNGLDVCDPVRGIWKKARYFGVMFKYKYKCTDTLIHI